MIENLAGAGAGTPGALVGAALGISMSQDVLAADLVVQGVETIAGFCLRFRVQRLLQMQFSGMQIYWPRYGPTVLVYCLVAIASALTEWLSFFIATAFVGPLTAAFVAFLIATSANYELSRAIAFLSKRSRGQEILLVFLMSAVAFLFNFAAFFCCLKLLDFSPITAKIIGTGSGFIMNYGLRQFVVFSREPRFASWASLTRLSGPTVVSSTDRQFTDRAPKP